MPRNCELTITTAEGEEVRSCSWPEGPCLLGTVVGKANGGCKEVVDIWLRREADQERNEYGFQAEAAESA